MLTAKETTKKSKIAYAMVFLSIFLFLIWRIRYGFANIDEAFYVSVPFRLVQGASMMSEEWGITQLSGFLLYPFVWLYCLIAGSTEGILLWFRILYIVVCGICTLYVYQHILPISEIGAAFSSVALLIYTPFGINALSYNSMGILFLTCCLATLVSTDSNRVFSWIVSGLFFAASALCCPYLVLLYIAVWAAVAFLCIRKVTYASDLIRILLLFTVGCCILAFPFVITVFAKTSVTSVIDSIPFILGDPSHQGSAISKLWAGVYMILVSYRGWCLFWMGEVLLAAVLCKVRVKKKIAKRLFFITGLFTAFSIIWTWYTIKYINHLPLVILPFSLVCFSLPHDRDILVKKLFWLGWVPGVLYAGLICLSSNQNVYVISSVSLCSFVGGVPIIFLTARELSEGKLSKREHVGLRVLPIILMVVFIACELQLRYYNVFWSTPINTQVTRIEAGPEKGLIVSNEEAEIYEDFYNSIVDIESRYDVHTVVFISKYSTIQYLIGEIECGISTSWADPKNGPDFYAVYYSMNPRMIPDMIYIASDSDGSFLSFLYEDGTYFQETALDGATVYIKSEKRD